MVVRSLATWRIADPERFLRTLRSRANAEERLADLILGEIGAALGRYPFAALVSSGDSQGASPRWFPALRRQWRPPRARRSGSRSSMWTCASSTCQSRSAERVRAHEGGAGPDGRPVPFGGRARRPGADRTGGRRARPADGGSRRAGAAHQVRRRGRGDPGLRRGVRTGAGVLQISAYARGVPEDPGRRNHPVPARRRRNLRTPAVRCRSPDRWQARRACRGAETGRACRPQRRATGCDRPRPEPARDHRAAGPGVPKP